MSRRNRTARPALGTALRLEPLEARETPAVIGALDPSFGTAGRATLAGAGIGLNDVVVDTAGRTVAVGIAAGAGGSDVLVLRFNPNGTPDTTFGTAGKVTVDFAGGFDTGNGIEFDTANNLVVVGTTVNAGVTSLAVAKLKAADGSLDAGFGPGVNGTVTLAAPAGFTELTGKAVLTDGANNITVLGTAGKAGVSEFAVARIDPTGNFFDTNFNGGAFKLVSASATSTDTAGGLAFDAAGNIVVAGSSADGGGSRFAVVRLKNNGTADATFNAGNVLTFTTVAASIDGANGVAVDAAGNVYLSGTSTLGLASSIAVAKVTAAGAPDGAFGTGGVFTTDPTGQGDSVGSEVQVTPGGRLVVAGTTRTAVVTDFDFVVAQLLPTGKLDTTFNAGGATPGLNQFEFGGNAADFANAVFVTASGRVVVAGTNNTTQGAEVARLAGGVERGQVLGAGGATNGTVKTYAASAATGQYATTPVATLTPFSGFTGSVRVAEADVDGDGVTDSILVTGPGTAPARFTVISGADNKTVLAAPTDPFGNATFTGGAFVSAGDLDNDGRAEWVVTPDQGGGGNVVIYSLVGTTATVRKAFNGLDPAFRGGARTAVGDINADGFAEVAVAAGFLGGPNVVIYDGKTVFGTPAQLVSSFFAFDGADAVTLRNGVFIALGDLNGDGFADVIAGGGPGGGPRVLAVSGKILTGTGTAAAQAAPISNFFAGNGANRGGVRLTTTDADGDGRADLVVGSGEGLASGVRVYLGKNITGSGEPAAFQDIDPFAATLAGGVFVG